MNVVDFSRDWRRWRLMKAPVEADGGFYTPGYLATPDDLRAADWVPASELEDLRQRHDLLKDFLRGLVSQAQALAESGQ